MSKVTFSIKAKVIAVALGVAMTTVSVLAVVEAGRGRSTVVRGALAAKTVVDRAQAAESQSE